jgi:hypothetical protein
VIDRRTFLARTGAVFLAAPLAAEAQPAQTMDPPRWPHVPYFLVHDLQGVCWKTE